MLRKTKDVGDTRADRTAHCSLLPAVMKRFHVLSLCISLVISSVLFLSVTETVVATPLTFEFTFSGEIFDNDATATGFLTVDDALFPNPSVEAGGDEISVSDPAILNLSLTVSGASSGNGTFGLNDFDSIAWGTGGVVLDFGQELVNQATLGDPWGTPSDGAGGDFNLFSSGSPNPDGIWFFTLRTNYESGDDMLLTSMRVVPEPATMLLLGTGLVGLGVFGRKKFKKA